MSLVKCISIFWLFLVLLPSASWAQSEVGNRADYLQDNAIEFVESARGENSEKFFDQARGFSRNVNQHNDDQLTTTKEQIMVLTNGMQNLRSKLATGVSREEAIHIEREIRRYQDLLVQQNDLLTALQFQADREDLNVEEQGRGQWDERRGHDDRNASDERNQTRRNENEHQPDRRNNRGSGEKERDVNELAFRLEHMHQAIGHLHESGLHEIAEQVKARAERLEREQMGRDGRRPDRMMQDMMEQIQMLARQVKELRREVQSLKR